MIISRLEAIEKRYNELNELLVSPDVTCDIKKLTTLSKEQRIEQPKPLGVLVEQAIL